MLGPEPLRDSVKWCCTGGCFGDVCRRCVTEVSLPLTPSSDVERPHIILGRPTLDSHTWRSLAQKSHQDILTNKENNRLPQVVRHTLLGV